MKNVALITGASSGIGRELAVVHAKKGGDMVVVARSEEKLMELKAELEGMYGVKVLVLVKDLTKESAVREVYDDLKNGDVEIEYLINNAGFGGQGYFHQRKWSVDRDMIQLNVIALAELCRLFLPDFVVRGRGRILNVSSTASLMPGPLQAVYFATKSFVSSFSNALAAELEGTGVTVTALMPGATETGFAKSAGLENTDLFKKTFSADVVASDGYGAMMKGKLEVISGVSVMQRFMFVLMKIVPKRMVMAQVKKMQVLKS